MLTQLKNELTPILVSTLREMFPDAAEEVFSGTRLHNLLERPKNIDHGHLALPCFQLAKELKTNPVELAKNLSQKLAQSLASLEIVSPVGGFLNFTFSDSLLQTTLIQSIKQPERMGFRQQANREKVVIDFASPNVAKPMHVGHFRATLIGQALRNLGVSQGFDVVAVNHLGDWGTQFGKLIWALQNWAPDFRWEDDRVIDRLLELYVRFHSEMETDSTLEAKGAEVFKRLEEKDPQIQIFWEKVVAASSREYDRLFAKLRIRHDQVLGESFYSDKLDDVIDRLEKAKLLEDSAGARVVFFDEKEKMPPCLIQKSDGASIYATRDLAAAFYRAEKMGAKHLLYVVGQDQSLHFKQIFRILERMGYAWAKNCHHIPFGMYRFKEGKMSTRKGRVIEFEDLITRAVQMVNDIIQSKNPDLPNKEKIVEQVAVGALAFNDLMNDRVKDVEFDWDKMLSFDGDSGPHVQYTAVRCTSILRKAQKPIPENFSKAPLALVESRVIYRILLLEEVLRVSYQNFKPNILAQYLLDLCSDFSQFYRDCRILGEPEELQQNRLLIVHATALALKQGLGVLNIEVPEAM